MPDGAPSSPRYPIPAGRHRVEQVIDRSRFLCTLAPVGSPDEAQAYVREISREFPAATHNCWAYVVGAPGTSDRIGLSLSIDYAAKSAVKKRLPEFEVGLLGAQYGVYVRLHLRCPEAHASRLRQVLLDVTRGQAVVEEATVAG